ncbi:MAG: T9SS type A sorting domain-containing protein [Candidatus Margulisiibacteriota bacterium]
MLSGSFSSPTIVFGDTVLSSAGGYDAFVAVFDLNWNIINAFTIGGPLDDGGIVDVDPNGMVYTLGGFQSPHLHLGTITLTNLDTLNPQTDLFLAKHSPFTEVKEDDNAPFDFSLAQNYPNPFNPQTAIGFSLLAVGNVTLKVYDVLGREVQTLLYNERIEAGRHEIQFDGSRLSSGVYYYRLQAGTFTETKKMVLMK